MKGRELKELCEATIKIVEAVGTFIMTEKGKVQINQIEEKDLNNFVSYLDKTAEIKLVEQLTKLIPDSTFLTEEETVNKSPEFIAGL